MHRQLWLNIWYCTEQVIFHIKPSTFRFRRNKRCLPQNALNAFCSKKNVVGYVEVFIRQILAHNDERGHIMTFVTQKLLYLCFLLKGSTWKTYSISAIPGRDPSKMFVWPTVAGANPAGKVWGGDFKNSTYWSVILSLKFLSELHKFMVNKLNFVVFRGVDRPNRSLPWICTCTFENPVMFFD